MKIIKKLMMCIHNQCNRNVGILGMYCKQHTPKWEYPIIEIKLFPPKLRRIKNIKEW